MRAKELTAAIERAMEKRDHPSSHTLGFTTLAVADFDIIMEALSARIPTAPIEAVAWRYNVLNTIVGTDEWRLSNEPPKAKTGERIREVQPLAPIKPSGDTGELRERVAGIIDANKYEAWTVDRANQMADAILDLIQSESEKGLTG